MVNVLLAESAAQGTGRKNVNEIRITRSTRGEFSLIDPLYPLVIIKVSIYRHIPAGLTVSSGCRGAVVPK
jgi:hypothetical protein